MTACRPMPIDDVEPARMELLLGEVEALPDELALHAAEARGLAFAVRRAAELHRRIDALRDEISECAPPDPAVRADHLLKLASARRAVSGSLAAALRLAVSLQGGTLDPRPLHHQASVRYERDRVWALRQARGRHDPSAPGRPPLHGSPGPSSYTKPRTGWGR